MTCSKVHTVVELFSVLFMTLMLMEFSLHYHGTLCGCTDSAPPHEPITELFPLLLLLLRQQFIFPALIVLTEEEGGNGEAVKDQNCVEWERICNNKKLWIIVDTRWVAGGARHSSPLPPPAVLHRASSAFPSVLAREKLGLQRDAKIFQSLFG